jgi:hypothetical protein
MNNKPTGKTRLKAVYAKGFFNKRIVLIHQTELECDHVENNAGIVTIETTKSWHNTRPEWLLENINEPS